MCFKVVAQYTPTDQRASMEQNAGIFSDTDSEALGFVSVF